MSYEKALSILKLNPGFTDIELKKAYKNMIKKYHPDNCANFGIDIIQNINSAYDFF